MRILFLLLAVVTAVPALAAQPRTFEFSYQVLAGELPTGEAVDIYLPLPAEHAGQHIVASSLQSNMPGEVGIEERHGNRYYRIRRPANINAPVEASLSWTVERAVVTAGSEKGASEEELARYLEPNKLVPVGHDILQPILAEIHAQRADDSPEATARAIYDWVVDNVEYKKVGSGWGNGDTFWACSERYGNCTDFHALFVALARSEGIPARFEIGFPVPLDRASGDIGGYHCWVQFYLPGQGWVPIDASEAAKHPEQRELLYGTHPADRVHFTTGRDLVVSAGSAQQPLNYFIYPYVEVGGKPWRVKLDTRFSYRELPAG
ncbi:MAG: transglutaminase domain-containing protein [Halieaceae bacterium]|nr:transglutaminase domain-containing protein [Halieaceae bacterium]MCP5164411.1 transglutaminase domain-containing protein [Pseudomonadales bacterium]